MKTVSWNGNFPPREGLRVRSLSLSNEDDPIGSLPDGIALLKKLGNGEKNSVLVSAAWVLEVRVQSSTPLSWMAV